MIQTAAQLYQHQLDNQTEEQQAMTDALLAALQEQFFGYRCAITGYTVDVREHNRWMWVFVPDEDPYKSDKPGTGWLMWHCHGCGHVNRMRCQCYWDEGELVTSFPMNADGGYVVEDLGH